MNPQYETRYGMGNNTPTQNGDTNKYLQARNSELETGALSRWLNPGIAEAAQFDRENYMMDKENAFNEYMFDKANAYNSPEAQMERAKAAGINPNLAAAGIMGQGNATAVPMQGARGDVGMNQNAINPIETLGNLANAIGSGISGANELGTMLGFGKKNVAEIKQIRENVTKLGEEWKYTRQQRRQLIEIGQVLVDNAKLEGKQIEQNIENLKRLNEVYQQQKYNIAADTNLKTEQTGTEIQNQKSIWYDNMRKEYEKVFREMFGAELTHDRMQFLVEAALNGHGEAIVNYFTDTIASLIKGIKKTATEIFKIPKLNMKPTPQTITTTQNGKEEQMIFPSGKKKNQWAKEHVKQAKKEWERTGKRKGQTFEKYLEIYASKRGIDIKDLIYE